MTSGVSIGVSIIVPLYNKAHTLHRSLNSALAQAGHDIEVIVVDDGSTDGSAQIVQQEYAGKVRLITQQNSGPSAARNRGVKEARKDICLFLDADDELLPNCIQVHMQAFTQVPRADISISSYQVYEGESLEYEKHIFDYVSGFAQLGRFGVIEGFHSGLVTGIHLPCVAVKKRFFETIGGFDDRLRCWEVTDFMFKAVLNALAVVLSNEITIKKHEDRISSQFTRTKKDTQYINIIAENILEQIHSVPPEHAASILKRIRSMMNELFEAKEYLLFKRHAAKACPLLKNYGLSNKLCRLAALPTTLLDLVHGVRRMLQRTGRN